VKLITSLLIVGCIVACAPAQWLEKTIVLPDTMSSFGSPGTMLYNTGNNFLFIGCERGLAVFDGLSNRLIAHVSSDHYDSHPGCYASQVNQLFWIGGSNDDALFILDGATGRELKYLVTHYIDSVCYNPVVNRVYVTVHDDSFSYLMIVSAASDSVVRMVNLGGVDYSRSVCCDPLDNRVYVSSESTASVNVVDCGVDSIVGTIPVGGAGAHLVYNRVSDKLYCYGNDTTVTIIDCHGDSVCGHLSMPHSCLTATFNPVANKLYCADYDGVDIISGQSGVLLGRVQFSREPRAMLFDSTDNLMWCSFYSDTIAAIDGQGDSLSGEVAVSNSPSAMCCNPTSGRLYVTEGHLTVVDPIQRKVDKRILLGFTPEAVCWATTSHKLYCAGGGEASLAVVDGAFNSVLGLVPVGRDPVALAYDRPLGIVCCANSGDSTVSIIKCNGDSVIATVKVGSPPKRLCVDTILHKAWCSSDSAVASIDLQTDSLTAVLPVSAYEITALLADPTRARVYCATAYRAHVVAFDEIGDSVVAEIPVGGDAQDLSLNPSANLIYCLNQSNEAVVVIDGATLKIVNMIPVGSYPQALLYCQRRNRLYCANAGSEDITVIDCSLQTPVDTIGLYLGVSALAYDSTADRLQCLDPWDGCLAIVDCRRDTELKVVGVGSQPVAAAYASSYRRMFVANEYGSSISVIRDTTRAGIEAPGAHPAIAKPAPTMVRHVLVLDAVGSRQNTAYRAELLDISGRKVMDLRPGANDVRALAPGVYFVRSQPSAVSRQPSAVTKVVITK